MIIPQVKDRSANERRGVNTANTDLPGWERGALVKIFEEEDEGVSCLPTGVGNDGLDGTNEAWAFILDTKRPFYHIVPVRDTGAGGVTSPKLGGGDGVEIVSITGKLC